MTLSCTTSIWRDSRPSSPTSSPTDTSTPPPPTTITIAPTPKSQPNLRHVPAPPAVTASGRRRQASGVEPQRPPPDREQQMVGSCETITRRRSIGFSAQSTQATTPLPPPARILSPVPAQVSGAAVRTTTWTLWCDRRSGRRSRRRPAGLTASYPPPAETATGRTTWPRNCYSDAGRSYQTLPSMEDCSAC